MEHSERDHALLSASGAHRWMNCTPSALLEDKVPDQEASIYAAEGTIAHELAELKLRWHYIEFDMDTKTYKKEAKKLEAKLKDLDPSLSFQEMDSETDKYVELVKEEISQLSEGRTILLEEELDTSAYIPEGFCTGDEIGIGDGILHIIDLKYGKGIRVDAPGNPQTRIYGLGALDKYELHYDIQKVKMIIIQPRLDHYSSETLTVEELKEWAEKELKPKAFMAINGKGGKVAGDWCKFCKVKAMCPALAKKNMDLAKEDFKEPELLGIPRVAEIFGQATMLLDWVNSMASYLKEQALKGEVIPGYKLVEGRSNRVISDEKEAIKALRAAKFKPSQYMISKLGGIGMIEKLVGKDNIETILEGIILKPEGAPTLVPESDKRPAMGIEQAKIDFQPEEEDILS